MTCVRLEGLRGFSAFFKQSAAIDIEMGINLRQAWGTIRREVGDLATGVFSVSVEDFPGPTKDGSCLSLGVPDVGVVPMKVQRAVTRERKDIRGEAIRARYALLSEKDPARLAFKAMGRTTALITLPNAQNCRSPRELAGDFVTLYGTDPELLEHEGKAFTAGGHHYRVDVHGNSLSVYNGTGSRRQTAHDVIFRKIADIMTLAGLQGVDVEDISVFKCCISSTARRRRYL